MSRGILSFSIFGTHKIRAILSWGILSQVNFFPGGFCRWGILTRGILSPGNFVMGDFVVDPNSETIPDPDISENVSSCPELQVVKMEFSISVDWRILTKRKGNSETLPDPEIGENVSSCPELRVIKIGHFC